MRTGEMNVRARVQRATETRDAEGGVERTWSTFKRIWCKVVGKGSDVFIEENQQQSKTTHRVTTRWTRGIGPAHRLVIRDRATGADRFLYISSVVDSAEGHKYLDIICGEDTK